MPAPAVVNEPWWSYDIGERVGVELLCDCVVYRSLYDIDIGIKLSQFESNNFNRVSPTPQASFTSLA
jgi:hypothetical protein